MGGGKNKVRDQLTQGCADSLKKHVKTVSRLEAQAIEKFKEFLEENYELLSYVKHWGDGEAGTLIAMLKDTLLGPPSRENPASYRKKRISASLRTKVFERDAYRCVKCGSWKDLCADHIYPEFLGGETTLDNLQTLCRTCNTKKGIKVEAGNG